MVAEPVLFPQAIALEPTTLPALLFSVGNEWLGGPHPWASAVFHSCLSQRAANNGGSVQTFQAHFSNVMSCQSEMVGIWGSHGELFGRARDVFFLIFSVRMERV